MSLHLAMALIRVYICFLTARLSLLIFKSFALAITGLIGICSFIMLALSD